MPSLTERIDSDLKSAMKASAVQPAMQSAMQSSAKLRVSVLRMAKAALKNRLIDKRAPLTEDEELAVLSTLSKQRRESIEQFRKAGREDLAKQEEDELAIIHAYLPEQMGAEELDGLILEAIKESGAKGASEMGKVMRLLMPKVKGKADGKAVNERVKILLEKT